MAAEQHGVVTRLQWLAAGLNRDADLLNAGFSMLRITDQRLKQNAIKEAQRLRHILRSR